MRTANGRNWPWKVAGSKDVYKSSVLYKQKGQKGQQPQAQLLQILLRQTSFHLEQSITFYVANLAVLLF